MFQRVGAVAYKKDLTNTIELCRLLDNPQEKLKFIHVAGTNGKGSVSHITASVLQAAGYKVGLYTSPHYKDFRERIKINGELIDEEYVIEFVARLKDEFEKLKPSFFEITVALAFDYFAERQVDIAVIETGLGGRLDSTNVLSPLISIITNIGHDHEDFLGTTLPEIAAEKAGIIKDKIPVIVGETNFETSPVFQKVAKERNAFLQFADQHFDVELTTKNLEGMCMNIYRDKEIYFRQLHTDLYGEYQLKNIATTLCSLEELRNQLDIPDEAIIKGLAHVRNSTLFIGRWEVLSRKPLIICDSGHNKEGLEEVFHELAHLRYNNLHVVFGLVKDKDLSKILPLLPGNASYYFCKPDIPRGLDVEVLRQAALAYQLEGKAYPSVKDALDNATTAAKLEDVIFIGGSIFVVAEVL